MSSIIHNPGDYESLFHTSTSPTTKLAAALAIAIGCLIAAIAIRPLGAYTAVALAVEYGSFAWAIRLYDLVDRDDD